MVPAMNDPETRGFVDGPAGPIAWRRFGSGPPLVLINGYAATKEDWDPNFLDSLGRKSTVYCPDNRALGESGGGPEDVSIGAMADDVLALMDAQSIESADVVAWSMGGFIAQTMAANAPERVKRLVLIATDPGGTEAARREDVIHDRLLDHSGTPDERARRLLALLFPPEVAAAIYEQAGEIVAAAQEALPIDVLRAQERAMEDWYSGSAETRLAAITAPVLAATGSLDEVIPPANAALLSERLPDAWLARFQGGGHAFMAQEPQRLGALIAAFTGR